MTYSEAIRLGAMLGPQAFGCLRRRMKSGTQYCASGGALEAIGKFPACSGDGGLIIWQTWPWAEARLADLPCGCFGGTTTTEAVFHLNDIHRWTRERIADWVETIEREHGLTEAPAAEPKPCEVSA